MAPPGWPVWTGKVFWAGLLIAALGTAFYMWRLYFLVFSGEARSAPAKEAHESPPSMTVPLIVLAFLATIAGVIGLPHLKSVHLPAITHGLSSWLGPVTAAQWNDPVPAGVVKAAGRLAIQGEPSDVTTGVLMLVAFAIGALGIGLAWMLYGRGPTRTVERLVEGPLAPVYAASRHKLWFDEIYEAILVRPFRVVARGFYEIADRFVIDTVAVNGTAFVIGLFGRIARWIQNGQVQRYLTGIVIGGALVFFVSRCRQEPSFDFTFEGNTVRLKAAPGEGVSSLAKIEWDLDGNGRIDATGSEITRLRGEVGTVTMWIEDPITRERIAVTRVVAETAPVERTK